MSEPDICLVCKDFKPQGNPNAGKYIYCKLEAPLNGHLFVRFWACKYCIPTTSTQLMRKILQENIKT